MSKITLATAFRYRNLLKKRIKQLQERFSTVISVMEIGGTEPTYQFDGMTFNQAMDRVYLLINKLNDLRDKIAEKNHVNTAMINRLERIKAQISFIEDVNRQHGNPRLVMYEDNETGGKKKTHLESIFNKQTAMELLKELKQAQMNTENDLATSNASITIDVDVDELQALL